MVGPHKVCGSVDSYVRVSRGCGQRASFCWDLSSGSSLVSHFAPLLPNANFVIHPLPHQRNVTPRKQEQQQQRHRQQWQTSQQSSKQHHQQQERHRQQWQTSQQSSKQHQQGQRSQQSPKQQQKQHGLRQHQQQAYRQQESQRQQHPGKSPSQNSTQESQRKQYTRESPKESQRKFVPLASVSVKAQPLPVGSTLKRSSDSRNDSGVIINLKRLKKEVDAGEGSVETETNGYGGSDRKVEGRGQQEQNDENWDTQLQHDQLHLYSKDLDEEAMTLLINKLSAANAVLKSKLKMVEREINKLVQLPLESRCAMKYGLP